MGKIFIIFLLTLFSMVNTLNAQCKIEDQKHNLYYQSNKYCVENNVVVADMESFKKNGSFHILKDRKSAMPIILSKNKWLLTVIGCSDNKKNNRLVELFDDNELIISVKADNLIAKSYMFELEKNSLLKFKTDIEGTNDKIFLLIQVFMK